MKRLNSREGAPQGASDPLPAMVAEFFVIVARAARLKKRMDAARAAVPEEVKRQRELAREAYDAHPAIVRVSKAWEAWGDETQRSFIMRDKIVNTAPLSRAGARASLRVFRYLVRQHDSGTHPLWRWGVTMAGAVLAKMRAKL